MSNFIIGCGHTASGTIGSGASDYLDESNCTREIAPLVIQYLKNQGHSATLLRIDKGNSSLYEDCHARAKQANDIAKTSNVDLYAEIHLNAGKNRTGDGTEVCITGKSNTAKAYANRICEKLSNNLNISNRGLVVEGLIVLNETSMPAILIECMFVDCDNPSKYNAEVIAKAITEGLTGQTISATTKLGWNQDSNGWWYCTDIINRYYYKDVWKLINGEWYSFDNQGYTRCKTWFKDKLWYYLKDSCKMAKNEWIWIDGECYCFDNNGAMYSNCFTPDGYWVNLDGSWNEKSKGIK